MKKTSKTPKKLAKSAPALQNQWQKMWIQAQSIWQNHHDIVLGVSFVVMVALLATLGQSNWFKSSLLESSNPFNGAIFPVDKSPDYTKWKGNIKTDKFDSISKSDLIDLPDYTKALKDISKEELDKNPDVKNAKLTFPVVYLGGYEGDFKENTGSHLAVDIRVPQGTPVKNIANGTVIKVSNTNSGFGHHLCIQHSSVPDYDNSKKKTTLISCYNHLDEIQVTEGEFILKGKQIATSGNTGTSTTPHLHFQIDRMEAPWHPYWPFSSAEQMSASLTFFKAVSTGLNKDQAAKMTVNPMLWIKDNYSTQGVSSKDNLVATTDNNKPPVINETNNTDTKKEELKLASFVITTDKDTFFTNEEISFLVEAKDQNGNLFKTYKASSDLVISSNSKSAKFSQTIKFLNGKSKLVVKNEVAENFEITIAQKDVKSSILLISKAIEEDIIEEGKINEEIVENNDNQNNNENTGESNTNSNSNSNETNNNESNENNEENEENKANTEENKNIAEVIFSGESFFYVGNSVNFYVELKDANGENINEINQDIEIKLAGSGTLTPNKITNDDLKNGKIALNYASNTVEEAKITILEHEFMIKAINEAKEAVGFKIFSENDVLMAETDSNVIVQAIDADGNDTPLYNGSGSVKLSFIDGEGVISPDTLESSDFNQGKAIVKVKMKDGNKKAKIQANAGIYSSESKTITVKTNNNADIFTDVPGNHANAVAIKFLKENNIIGGYNDGSFQPDKEVTRIEALKMLLLAFNKGLEPAQNINFPDTDSGEWYAPYIGRALILGMVKGYPDGSFKPNNSINRAEYYKTMLSASGVEIETFHGTPYQDVPADTWFTDAVGFAKENNITDAKKEFKPNGNVTRAEVAETIYRVLKL